MAEAPPAARVVARRVLFYEAGGRMEPAALAEAAERADARLRARLADLIGLTGYMTLVARAVRLPRPTSPPWKESRSSRGSQRRRGACTACVRSPGPVAMWRLSKPA